MNLRINILEGSVEINKVGQWNSFFDHRRPFKIIVKCLRKALKGCALDAVRSRLLLPDNVSGVIKTLRLLFGRPELIINALLQKIRSDPSPKIEKMETIVQFALSVENLVSTMEAAKLQDHLSNPLLLEELVNKLPSHLKMNWGRHKRTAPNSTALLTTLSKWLYSIVEDICEATPNVIPLNTDNNEKKSFRGKDYVNTHIEKKCSYVNIQTAGTLKNVEYSLTQIDKNVGTW